MKWDELHSLGIHMHSQSEVNGALSGDFEGRMHWTGIP